MTAVQTAHERYELLDTWVDAFTIDSFVEHLEDAVDSERPHLIANHNINSLALLRGSAGFRAFYRRPDAIFVDGMGIVAVARLLGLPVEARHRIGVLDWIWPVFELAEREGWRIAHVGGDDEVLDRAVAKILQRHPSLQITTINGYFDVDREGEDNQLVLKELHTFEPDLLLVGMGMPRQEEWVLDNFDALPPCTVVTVGGILGYLGGDRSTAPRWVGRIGLEWLFRLLTEPRRLWRRYLVEPFPLVPGIARGVARRFGLERRGGPGGRGGQDR